MITGGTNYVYLAHVTLLNRRNKENLNSNHNVISQPMDLTKTQRQKDVQTHSQVTKLTRPNPMDPSLCCSGSQTQLVADLSTFLSSLSWNDMMQLVRSQTNALIDIMRMCGSI